MLRKKWLALVATVVCGMTNRAHGQSANVVPVVPVMGPISAPVVQFVDNHEQPDTCHSGLMGGGALYFLRPFINNNTAFVTTIGIGTAAPVQAAQDFDWNYHVAPAAWVGWSSKCGVGFRARFFEFDQSSQPLEGTLDANAATTTVIAPPSNLSPLAGTPPRGFQSPGILLQSGIGEDFLTAQSDLRIRLIDGEATYAHEWCHFGMLISIGGRVLQMHQNYQSTLTNIPFAGTSEMSLLESNRTFNGGGPTASWQARWEIGRSGLAVFGLIRGSLLIGTQRQGATFTEVIVDPVAGNQNNQATNQSHDHLVLPIGELEGGLEYSRAVGRTRFFVRGAAVNQTYFDAGSASSREGNLSLFGAQVSFGLNY